MKKNFVRALFVAALMSTAAMTTASTSAFAADHLSKDVATDLKAAQDALQAKDTATAILLSHELGEYDIPQWPVGMEALRPLPKRGGGGY